MVGGVGGGGGVMSVSCPVCGKRLSNKYNLRIHIRDKHETHEGSRPTCATCCRTFKNANSLRVHSIKQHGHISNRRRLRAAAAAAAIYQHHRHHNSFTAFNTAIASSMQSQSNTLHYENHNSPHQQSSSDTRAVDIASQYQENSYLQSLAANDSRSNNINRRLHRESLGHLFSNRRLSLDEDGDEGPDEVSTLLNSLSSGGEVGGDSRIPYASCQSLPQTNSSSNKAYTTTTTTPSLTPPFGGPPHLRVEEPSPRLTSPAFRETHPQQ